MHWTPALEDILGFDNGGGPGTLADFLNHIDAGDRESVTARLRQAIDARAPEFSTAFWFEKPNGQRSYLECHGRFVFDDGGAASALMAVMIDATERRNTELQLQQAQKMEAIGRLAGGVAHDFNNLLTAILGHSELILNRIPDAELKEDIEEIKKAGERASQLTRQLLAFSRKQMLVPQVLDLNTVIVDLGRMLSRVIGEDIKLEIVPGTPIGRTKVDPVQVEQILMNLVVNSRDAMPEGGTIRISTANADVQTEFVRRHGGLTGGRFVVLRVEDTGSGMAPGVLEHAFEPFFTTKSPGKGTGLGLSSVHGIVNQSGGFVTLDSGLGVGTTVTAYFPVVAETAAPVVAKTSPQSTNGAETILLVEDDISVRSLIVRTLSKYGYHILEARDVPDAIAIASKKNGTIHLLLTDIVMPVMNGPNLAQIVVRDHPAIKVLYVSGFSWSTAVGAGSMSARAAFLAKPFTPATLAAAVRDCLDRDRAAGL